MVTEEMKDQKWLIWLHSELPQNMFKFILLCRFVIVLHSRLPHLKELFKGD